MSYAAARSFMDKIYHDNDFRTKNLPPDSASEEAKLAAAVKVGSQNGLDFTQQEFRDVQSVKAFWKKASQDQALQKELTSAGATENRDQMTKRIVDIAAKAGYSFPTSAVMEISGPALDIVHGVASKSELDEKELSSVVGGATSLTSFATTSYSSLSLNTLSSPLLNKSYDTVMCPWYTPQVLWGCANNRREREVAHADFLFVDLPLSHALNSPGLLALALRRNSSAPT